MRDVERLDRLRGLAGPQQDPRALAVEHTTCLVAEAVVAQGRVAQPPVRPSSSPSSARSDASVASIRASQVGMVGELSRARPAAAARPAAVVPASRLEAGLMQVARARHPLIVARPDAVSGEDASCRSRLRRPSSRGVTADRALSFDRASIPAVPGPGEHRGDRAGDGRRRERRPAPETEATSMTAAHRPPVVVGIDRLTEPPVDHGPRQRLESAVERRHRAHHRCPGA